MKARLTKLAGSLLCTCLLLDISFHTPLPCLTVDHLSIALPLPTPTQLPDLNQCCAEENKGKICVTVSSVTWPIPHLSSSSAMRALALSITHVSMVTTQMNQFALCNSWCLQELQLNVKAVFVSFLVSFQVFSWQFLSGCLLFTIFLPWQAKVINHQQQI